MVPIFWVPSISNLSNDDVTMITRVNLYQGPSYHPVGDAYHCLFDKGNIVIEILWGYHNQEVYLMAKTSNDKIHYQFYNQNTNKFMNRTSNLDNASFVSTLEEISREYFQN